MPPLLRGLAVAAAVLLLGLTGLTAWAAVLRARARERIERWSATAIVALLVSAAVPWLVVWLAPITISVDIHTIPVLIGWLLLALLAFALLVLLPLAAALSAIIWWRAWRRGRATPPATT